MSVQLETSAEYRPGVRRRQYRTVAQKRQIVQETLKPGASVAVIARRHGVNANQLFAWRRQFHGGLLEPSGDGSCAEQAALVPIAVASIASSVQEDGSRSGEPDDSGHILIEFCGGRRVSVWGQADVPTLCAILRELSRA